MLQALEALVPLITVLSMPIVILEMPTVTVYVETTSLYIPILYTTGLFIYFG